MKKTVGAIIEKNRKILLTKRNVEPFKGLWCLPGGHIEPGENAEDAVKREVREETGLDFRPVFFMKDIEEIPSLKWLAEVSFFTGTFIGDIKKDNAEVQETGWFKPKEIKNMEFAFNHKKILEKYFEKNG